MHCLSPRASAIRALTLTILCAAATAFAQDVPGLAGRYEGTLEVPNGERKVVLDLDKNAKGAWIGSISVTPGAADLPVEKLVISGKEVSFAISAPNAPSMKLAFDGEAKSLKGNLIAGPNELPLNLKRTGDAKVVTPVESTPLAKEFEGSWMGTLNTPGGALRVQVKMSNGPDGKAAATLTSLDQGNQAVPVSTVLQKGDELTFGIRTLGGFKGTMNAEKTEISGTWTQGNNKLPLVLKKEGTEPKKPTAETAKP